MACNNTRSQKYDLEDRLSELPDDILLNIVDRLQIRDAARTSVLSRRWLQLPTMLSKLIIDIVHFLPEDWAEVTMDDLFRANASLVEATKRILACRNGDQYAIRMLSMRFYLRDDDSIPIGQIVANTMAAQKIDAVEFTILTAKQDDECADADFVEYGRQFKYFFNSCPNVFGGLTHFQLQNLRFGESDVPNILMNCKRLVFLCLENCDAGFRSVLQVEHRELTELEIASSRFDKVVLKFLPKLTQLIFDGWMSIGDPFVFGHVPLLRIARVKNTGLSWHKMLRFSELLRGATSLCELHLNFRSEKIWVKPEGPKQLARVFHNLIFVNLVNIPKGCDLSWTMFILEGAPYLQKLYLNVRDHLCEMRRARSYSEKKNVECEELPFDFKHQNLALLVIFGFESEDHFVRYIRRVMDVAVNLEDIFLYTKLACWRCRGKATMANRFPRTKKQQCSMRNRIAKGAHSLAMRFTSHLP